MLSLPKDFSWRYQVILPSYAFLPPAISYRLAALQSYWVKRQRCAERLAITYQLQRAFPYATPRQIELWIQDYYCMVEQEALDSWYLTHKSVNELVTLENFAVVQQARTQGKRVLLTSGHFGRFWLAGVAMRALGFTTGTITRDGGNENIHGLPPAEYRYRLWKLKQLQQQLGGPFLVEGNDIRPFYRVLDQHLIALIFDVPYVNGHKSGVTVPFIDGNIQLPAGIYRVAKKTKAVVAPFFMRDRGNGSVVAEFSALLDPLDYNETTLLSLLAAQLAERIRENPGQWWLWPALPLLRSTNNNESRQC